MEAMVSGLNSGVVLSLMAVLWTVVWQNLQHLRLQQFFARNLNRHARRLAALVDPYLSVTIAEYEGGRMKRSDAYEEVKAYLSDASARGVRHLRAEGARDADRLVLSMSEGEEVEDVFQGARVFWGAHVKQPPRSDGAAAFWGGAGAAASQEERRYYRLYFLDRHRSLVLDTYLPRVRQMGRAVMVKNRQRKLFTNISTGQFSDRGGGFMRSAWSHVPFEHPKTFATLAMDPVEKKRIVDDLDMFRNGRDYYARVGKAWKRGYLLYGPPGTGKSAMVAAMANYLDYDIYDVELTVVHTNSDLRKLLIETTSKSIIVIEDIDCTLEVTGDRAAASCSSSRPPRRREGADERPRDGVTLSGLLNFIDGLWSACGGERIVVFTTNHVEKLDPALIRRGRMDMHVEMSYCRPEAFQTLAKNYLDVDDHELFGAVGEVLREEDLTPADVAECLMAARRAGSGEPARCLEILIDELKNRAVEKAKAEAEAKVRAEAEAKARAEAEAKAAVEANAAAAAGDRGNPR